MCDYHFEMFGQKTRSIWLMCPPCPACSTVDVAKERCSYRSKGRAGQNQGGSWKRRAPQRRAIISLGIELIPITLMILHELLYEGLPCGRLRGAVYVCLNECYLTIGQMLLGTKSASQKFLSRLRPSLYLIAPFLNSTCHNKACLCSFLRSLMAI
jgi:hypothetical protein